LTGLLRLPPLPLAVGAFSTAVDSSTEGATEGAAPVLPERDRFGGESDFKAAAAFLLGAICLNYLEKMTFPRKF